ncbi:MAG TPA: hypothetical protein PLA57_00685 [Candidatus Paceibacterota bacterium]|jgi:cell division protein FtsL|nr:hypothetical protein [Candidatus Paceibacterota bacterium]HRS47713.1 hypothetical protein [Candidatus Paceibacterota bacterium]
MDEEQMTNNQPTEIQETQQTTENPTEVKTEGSVAESKKSNKTFLIAAIVIVLALAAVIIWGF